MRSKIAIAILVVALLSIGAWSGKGQTEKVKSVSYDYQVLTDPTEVSGLEDGQKKLNELGAQGWELAGVSAKGNSASKLYFKRVKGSL
jgi:hypothetical protein